MCMYLLECEVENSKKTSKKLILHYKKGTNKKRDENEVKSVK